MGFFGLSESGKSTLTHESHNNKYKVKILHDDAFVISTTDGSAVALEPSYFDKTQDYPPNSPSNKYLITAQNCGAALNEEGKLVLVTEDVRNGNGRAIKSKLWASNRVDKFSEPVNAIAWLMKDPTMPPVVKINNPKLAAVMGATLATKRTSAERMTCDVDMDSLVIEPYANPFRTYPLNNVDCYILNTSSFGEKKALFKPWGNFSELEIFEVDDFVPDMKDVTYIDKLRSRLQDRLGFLESLKSSKGGRDQLDDEALAVMRKLIAEVK